MPTPNPTITPRPAIVALTGPAGAGKDTVADYLAEHHGYTKLAFADALRDEVGRAFDVSVKLLTQRETKEHHLSALALQRCMDYDFVDCMRPRLVVDGRVNIGKPHSPRQIMQWWGTEYRRAQNPHYWLDAFTTRLVRAQVLGHHWFVVTDVRAANEAALLRELGASLWQITRPGFEPQPGAHSSETTGAEFAPDHQLVNSHSITHLHKLAYAALIKSHITPEAA